MEMDVNEIKKRYEQSKNKKRQIGILAELNECTRDEIRAMVGVEQIHVEKGSKLPQIDTETDCIRNWIENNLERLETEIKSLEEQYKKFSNALLVLGEFEERNV